jgi:hypothetical protein
MGAMAAEHPSIVKGEHHRYLAAEDGQTTQVEVVAVEGVAVNDVGPLGGEPQQLPATRIIEILNTPEPPPIPTWLGHRSGKPPELGNALYHLQRLELGIYSRPEPVPQALPFRAGNQKHIRVCGMFLAHRHPGGMAQFTVLLEKGPGNLLAAASAQVSRVYLEDVQFLTHVNAIRQFIAPRKPGSGEAATLGGLLQPPSYAIAI